MVSHTLNPGAYYLICFDLSFSSVDLQNFIRLSAA